ncbi:PAS domain S-box protein, partial [bacterium]
MTSKLLRKRKENIFGALIRDSADGIYVVSRGVFEYVNSAFEKLVGASAEEICDPGFDMLDFVHPDDKKLVRAGTEARGRIFEFRIVSRDGATKYVEAGTSVLSGNGGRIMGILRETTARRLEDRSLRENEEKYRLVVERATDGIAIIQDSLFKYINPRAAEMGGFTLDELIDTPFGRYLATEDITTLESTYKRESGAED